jgi:ribosomal protein S20
MNSQTFENKTKLKNSLNSTYSLIDKASKKKFFHKNTAARKKSTLIKKFNTI